MSSNLSSNIPSLVPVASPTEEETDSFLGQSSAQGSGQRVGASSYFASDSNSDLFVVGEGQPPPSASAAPLGQVPMIPTFANNSQSPVRPPLPPPMPPMTQPPPSQAPIDPLQPPPLAPGPHFVPPGPALPPPNPGVPQVSMMAPPPLAAMPPAGPAVAPVPYLPVQWHWFFSRVDGLSITWRPFSSFDSGRLESALMAGHHTESIATDGGRYDVRLTERRRYPVYWEEPPAEVRRCSWFFRPEGDTRYVPYEERLAQRLEGEYMRTIQAASWHRRLEIAVDDSGRCEVFVFHNPQAMMHYRGLAQPPDEYGITGDQQSRPCVVKRGLNSVEDIVDEGEYQKIDHVVFVIHGIGSVCDLKGRNLVECVDHFRSISNSLIKSHFQSDAGRVEFLPVHWHGVLHGEATGLDHQLKKITLGSIPKLRNYTNDTLIDILFYTSPKYCQTIVDTVSGEINRLLAMFMMRNPKYAGAYSIAGHSLGSVIAFDILAHQGETKQLNGSPNRSRSLTPQGDSSGGTASDASLPEEDSLERMLNELGLPQSLLATFEGEQVDMESLALLSESDLKELGLALGPRKKILGYLNAREKKSEKESASSLPPANLAAAGRTQSLPPDFLRPQKDQEVVNFVVGTSGVGQPLVTFPRLDLASVSHFFALGSPIALFLTTRGLEFLGEEFRLPTCRAFFNIFHPFDPVAYRMETMIRAPLACRPVLIPHHKGRKRMHLELKENLARVGADLKAKIVDSLRSTWRSLHQFATAHRYPAGQEAEDELAVEQEVNEALSQMQTKVQSDEVASSLPDEDLMIGQLNQGRRIDHVLQESPLESFNDYIFALSSHACYWDSEDTVLLILKEIYIPLGVQPVTPAIGGPPKKNATPLPPPPMPPMGPPYASTISEGPPPPPMPAMGSPYAVAPSEGPSPGPAALLPPSLAPPMPGSAPPTNVSWGSAPLLPRHGSLFRHK